MDERLTRTKSSCTGISDSIYIEAPRRVFIQRTTPQQHLPTKPILRSESYKDTTKMKFFAIIAAFAATALAAPAGEVLPEGAVTVDVCPSLYTPPSTTTHPLISTSRSSILTAIPQLSSIADLLNEQCAAPAKRSDDFALERRQCGGPIQTCIAGTCIQLVCLNQGGFTTMCIRYEHGPC